ncbi:MAG: hypothetical protein HYU56_02105 [Candidatus Aenigmarchaeota archaeon]|nr:hypothetical protein [Candidatus Aenigmarchaeota archaeon]
MADNDKQILKELKEIRTDIGYIKEHMIDTDMILTDDDIKSIKEAEKDLKEGKTKRLV